jgi:LAS superfamily LD-carboxypeptidase LdcB
MRVPSPLKKVPNGELPTSMLKGILAGGFMYTDAANAFNRMYREAQKAGITFRSVGDYRPLNKQEALFNDRYSLKDEGRVPQVTRTYKKKKWFLKKGKAPAGVPGTSNHGLGLAIDLGIVVKGKTTTLDAKAIKWLCNNGPKFGFYLQVSDPKNPEFEIWHWQYCLGEPLP